jgi:hypothetical protein
MRSLGGKVVLTAMNHDTMMQLSREVLVSDPIDPIDQTDQNDPTGRNELSALIGQSDLSELKGRRNSIDLIGQRGRSGLSEVSENDLSDLIGPTGLTTVLSTRAVVMHLLLLELVSPALLWVSMPSRMPNVMIGTIENLAQSERNEGGEIGMRDLVSTETRGMILLI